MGEGRRQINEDELGLFFSLIGQGIWYLQHVENALVTCLTVKGELKKPGSIEKDEAERILSKHRKNTLGTSIRIAEKKGVLSPELMNALRKFKNERDWLVHRSMAENGDDLYTDAGREGVLMRLYAFSEEAQALQRLVAKELEDYVVANGVSRQWIHRRAMQDIQTKQGGDA